MVPLFNVEFRYTPARTAITIIGTAVANALMNALFFFNWDSVLIALWDI